ncbi:hypothetical protein AB664_39355 [Brucella anthropi]|uniref:Uncharacterized protein n=1 Tax=Brucella anthropi TaxID=529 RepID=A0A656Z4H4_BRUAN|nr:hypothetical protein AB664_39355 [Brucella anthropi]
MATIKEAQHNNFLFSHIKGDRYSTFKANGSQSFAYIVTQGASLRSVLEAANIIFKPYQCIQALSEAKLFRLSSHKEPEDLPPLPVIR